MFNENKKTKKEGHVLSWFEEMLTADQFCPVLKLLYPDERGPFQYMTVPPSHVTRAQRKLEYEVNVNNVLWITTILNAYSRRILGDQFSPLLLSRHRMREYPLE